MATANARLGDESHRCPRFNVRSRTAQTQHDSACTAGVLALPLHRWLIAPKLPTIASGRYLGGPQKVDVAVDVDADFWRVTLSSTLALTLRLTLILMLALALTSMLTVQVED